MGNLLAYSGTAAKIRALRSRLLTPEDYRRLASASSVTDALACLRQKPAYRELFSGTDAAALHRGDIEKLLTSAVYQDFQSIYLFSPIGQRKFLDLYFRRYEIAILKTCLRMVFDHRDVTLNLRIFSEFFGKHSDINLEALAASRSVQEFTENLKGSIYYGTLSRLSPLPSPTLWDYEMSMDLFYFRWFFTAGEKLLKKEELAHFREAYGTKIDLLNLLWICRSRLFFHMESADIYAHLISVQYRLRTEDLKALAQAESPEDFLRLIGRTCYGKYFTDCTASHMQETYRVIRRHVQHRAATRDPYSIAPVISYLYDKEHEVTTITTILECVRYGLPLEKTKKYAKEV